MATASGTTAPPGAAEKNIVPLFKRICVRAKEKKNRFRVAEALGRNRQKGVHMFSMSSGNTVQTGQEGAGGSYGEAFISLVLPPSFKALFSGCGPIHAKRNLIRRSICNKIIIFAP